jgi:hypothetical protein
VSHDARWRRGRRGAAVLYAVLLTPVLLLGLTLAVAAGALQLERQRVRSAADEALVAAAAAAAGAGDTATVDPVRAAAVTRRALADALRPLEAEMAAGGAAAVADAAEVAVIDVVPAADPFVPGVVVRRPSVEARIRVPLRTGMLQLAAVAPVVTVTVVAAADLRRAGDGDR